MRRSRKGRAGGSVLEVESPPGVVAATGIGEADVGPGATVLGMGGLAQHSLLDTTGSPRRRQLVTLGRGWWELTHA